MANAREIASKPWRGGSPSCPEKDLQHISRILECLVDMQRTQTLWTNTKPVRLAPMNLKRVFYWRVGLLQGPGETQGPRGPLCLGADQRERELSANKST